MNASKLETTDIFLGAFLLCIGGILKNVSFLPHRGNTATFIFTGSNLQKHDKDYRIGKALVNPLQFREELNHLRDVLFEKQRKEKGRYDYGTKKRMQYR